MKKPTPKYTNIADRCETIAQVDAALREVSTMRAPSKLKSFRKTDMIVIDSLLDRRLEITQKLLDE